jgi:hypothetical protein
MGEVIEIRKNRQPISTFHSTIGTPDDFFDADTPDDFFDKNWHS